jgi:uncharacterized membrane protein
MNNLLAQLFDKLGAPNEQKSEKVALAIVYCMFLSFAITNLLGVILIMQLGQPKHVQEKACSPTYSASQSSSQEQL